MRPSRLLLRLVTLLASALVAGAASAACTSSGALAEAVEAVHRDEAGLLLSREGLVAASPALREQFARLKAAANLPGARLVVFGSLVANAHAYADGTVAVSRALVEGSGLSSDELVAVLAHELAHLVHRHAVERACRLARGEPLEAVMREQEVQADATAVALLSGLGIGPQALASALVRLDTPGMRQARKARRTATHPETLERLQALAGLAAP